MAEREAHSLFAEHPRSWRDNRYVYAVVSRRARGLSIGVNLNPDKTCNFDCVYCCVDRATEPAEREVHMDLLAAELDHMLGLALSGRIWQEQPFDQTPTALRRVNDVAFSGDGEPTACERFSEACRRTIDLVRRRGAADLKIILITNATLLHRPAVQAALAELDSANGEIWAKLDAGTQDHYQRIERSSVPFQRVLDNLLLTGRVRPIVIQSLFLELDGAGPDDAETAAYVRRLADLRDAGCRIKLVQVYTVARKTAETRVTPLALSRLQEIAERVRALGLDVQTYG
jgi:wyosine [tRNA(Phe)-imidazoG37] synthetase (radical SAM superfamily)